MLWAITTRAVGALARSGLLLSRACDKSSKLNNDIIDYTSNALYAAHYVFRVGLQLVARHMSAKGYLAGYSFYLDWERPKV